MVVLEAESALALHHHPRAIEHVRTPAHFNVQVVLNPVPEVSRVMVVAGLELLSGSGGRDEVVAVVAEPVHDDGFHIGVDESDGELHLDPLGPVLLPGRDHDASFALDVAGRGEVGRGSQLDQREESDDREENDNHGDQVVEVAAHLLARETLEQTGAELVESGDEQEEGGERVEHHPNNGEDEAHLVGCVDREDEQQEGDELRE